MKMDAMDRCRRGKIKCLYREGHGAPKESISLIKGKLYAFLLLMVISLLGGRGVYAASLTVSPLSVQLSQDQPATTIMLKNADKRPTTIQIRIFSWDIQSGREVEIPTTELIASPPTIKLNPNQEYVVRIIRISRRPVTREETYRLVLDELPGPPSKSGAVINLLIRQSLPVFVHGPQTGDPDIRWSIISEGKKYFLQAENVGPRYTKVFNVSLSTSGSKSLTLAKNLSGYVLSGRKQIWPISNLSPKGSFVVRGESTIGKFEVRVSLVTE